MPPCRHNIFAHAVKVIPAHDNNVKKNINTFLINI